MPDDTTPSPEGGQSTQQENWELRYKGLQAVVAKRDEALAAHQRDLDALRAEHEAATTALNEYRVTDAALSEEALARQQFDQLKARFEPQPRKLGNNPGREWSDPSAGYADRERKGTVSGFPV